MVVGGDKNYKHIDEGPIRAGRRTRSPTTTVDDSSNSDSEDGGMRVGNDYQATIPECNINIRPDNRNDAMLVWAPCSYSLSEERIDEYVQEAKEKHGYNMEQALGMLFWHKHSIEKALSDLPNFTPFPDDWTAEDRVLFEQAFTFHGKSFHRIRQMLPDKSIGCLVKFYYSWKKTRSRTSLIDRQAHKSLASRDLSDDEADTSDHMSDTEQDNGKENNSKEGGTTSTASGVAQQGRAGIASSRKLDNHARMKNKRRPPRGMYLNRESLLGAATAAPGQGDIILKQLQMELVKLKRQVQNNKQVISSTREKAKFSISQFRVPEISQKVNGRWTNEELLLAVQGVRKYGKDFKAIAEVIGNKTEALVRSFYVNYRRRYNLDEVLAEYTREENQKNNSNGCTELSSDATAASDKPIPMDVDSIANSVSSTSEQPAVTVISTTSLPSGITVSAGTVPATVILTTPTTSTSAISGGDSLPTSVITATAAVQSPASAAASRVSTVGGLTAGANV